MVLHTYGLNTQDHPDFEISLNDIFQANFHYRMIPSDKTKRKKEKKSRLDALEESIAQKSPRPKNMHHFLHFSTLSLSYQNINISKIFMHIFF